VRNAGKLVIVVIFAVAIGAALVSLWHHRASGRRALEFWGTETAVLIARAPRIEAIWLAPADSDRESSEDQGRPIRRLGIGGRFYIVKDTRDASQARGVSNIRRALVLDVSFQWDAPERRGPPDWQYAFEFRDGERAATVFFDFDSRQVGANTSTKTALLDPAAADDWHKFFLEQFENRTSKR
jgi:hypothetical protein